MTGLVRVWLMPVDVPPSAVARCWAVLDDGERARAAAYQDKRPVSMPLGVRKGHYRNQVPEMKTVGSRIESDVHRSSRFAKVCVYVIACGGFQKSAPTQFFEEVIIVLCCHLLKVADCPYLPTRLLFCRDVRI